jgi:hypothetical protein
LKWHWYYLDLDYPRQFHDPLVEIGDKVSSFGFHFRVALFWQLGVCAVAAAAALG